MKNILHLIIGTIAVLAMNFIAVFRKTEVAQRIAPKDMDRWNEFMMGL